MCILPVQPDGRGPPREHRRRGAGIRAEDLTRMGHRAAGRPAPSSCGASRPRRATGPATTPPAEVFQGEWLCTGDTYVQDDDGYYICLGRTSDMLKVSGIWMSPAEVEERLLEQRPSVRWPSWPRRTPTGCRSRSRSCCSNQAWCDRGRAHRVLPAGAAVVQAAPQGRFRDRLSHHGEGQDPPRRAAPDGRQVRAQHPPTEAVPS